LNVLGAGGLSDASPSIRAASIPDAPGQPSKVSATTSQISTAWSVPNFNGGNAI